MKKLAALVAGATLVAFAAACATDTNTNAVNENRVVVNTNANGNAVANANVTANANTNARTYNANISQEEYNKEKERYAREAKEKGESIGQGLEDGWLWVKVKGKLATVDDLRDSTINVDVDNAVVTLRGSVANAAQKTKAVETAKSVSGVKSVKDQLTINASAGVLTNGNGNSANHNAGNHNK